MLESKIEQRVDIKFLMIRNNEIKLARNHGVNFMVNNAYYEYMLSNCINGFVVAK